MKKVVLRGTDLEISQIVLGTDVYGLTLSEEESFAMLDAYVELGGNALDTALIYSDWAPGEKSRSEKLIGRWMKARGNRNKLIVSTKGAHPPIGYMDISRLSRSDIEGDMERSLRHLQSDYVDIYWLHRDDTRLPAGEIMETLNDLVKTGKTRSIGLSNWTHERIGEANDYAKAHGLSEVVAGQIQYSAAEGVPANNDPTLVLMNEGEYAYYKQSGMAVFAYAAQAKGLFSKLDQGGVEALSSKAQDRYLSEENLRRFALLKELSGRYGASVGQLAIAAICSNRDFPTFPIVGCKNIPQLTESMGGAGITMEQSDIDRLLHRL